MTLLIDNLGKDFLLKVAKGKVAGHSLVNKFGYNGTVGTSFTPICSSGTYQTPIADTSIEIVSDSTNDTAGGSGARTVSVEGINLAGVAITEEIALNGLTPVELSNQFFRIFRLKTLTSGSYAGAIASSHNGTIKVNTLGDNTEIWGQIDVEGSFGLGQSQIGAYTIPAGKTGFLLNAGASIESLKTVDLYFFQRNNGDVVTAPYDTMRLMQEFHGAGGNISLMPTAPINGFHGFTDIGVIGKTTVGTAGITVTMQILLVEDYLL